MKRNTIIKLLIALVAFVAIGTLFGFVGGAIGGHLAMAAAASAGEVTDEPVTTEVTADKSELLKNTVSKNISKMHPDRYPFDTILRDVGLVVPVKSWETGYFEVETRMLEDAIKTAFTASGTTSPAWTVQEITVNNVFMWAVDDNVLVQGIDGSDGGDLVLHVIDMTTTTLKVIAVNGIGDNGADIPALAVDTKLTRIGNAKEETAAQTTPYAVMPQKQYNYSQIHMAQVEQSFYDKLHEKWAEWDLNQFRSEAIWDMRGQMEFASLFGVRKKIYDPVAKKWKYLSGGITRFMTKNISKSKTGFDDDTFIDIAKEVFTGNNGAQTRVLFAGSGLLSTMSKAPTYQKQILQRDTKVIWGIEWNEIVSPYGKFLVKHHTGLNYTGWTDKGIVIDVNNLEKHVFKTMETSSIDFSQSGQRKTNADVIDEAFCVALKNPDTHAIITTT